MNAVRLTPSLRAAIAQHARATYPDECCGFLIGLPEPATPEGPRTITAVRPAANDYAGERRRRFEIRPEELRDEERRVGDAGLAVLGFYHSHPDHPARPSEFDRDHAWPWYAYLVASVTREAVPAIGAFELDPDTQEFRELPLEDAPDRLAPLVPELPRT